LEKPDFFRERVYRSAANTGRRFFLKPEQIEEFARRDFPRFARAANDPHLPLFQYSLTVGTIEHAILMTAQPNIF
jgi:hypothetical protein